MLLSITAEAKAGCMIQAHASFGHCVGQSTHACAQDIKVDLQMQQYFTGEMRLALSGIPPLHRLQLWSQSLL